jgi:hypothetical protein
VSGSGVIGPGRAPARPPTDGQAPFPRTYVNLHPVSQEPTMSSEENKRLVRRFYAEIDNGNVGIIDELVGEAYIDHNPPPFPAYRQDDKA